MGIFILIDVAIRRISEINTNHVTFGNFFDDLILTMAGSIFIILFIRWNTLIENSQDTESK